jgi:outer membrane protein assembly factor BamB
LTQRSRFIAAALGLLLLGVLLSACGAAPVAQTWPGLTVDGDTVYAISGAPQQVYMIDAETGTQKGTFLPQGENKGVLYWSPVTVADGVAYVGFSDTGAGTAGLYAFDPATGQELWHVPVQSYIQAAPAYADGTIYVGDTVGYVFAVDVEERTIKPGWPFRAKDAVWAEALVVDGRVYVASMDHRLYCLDAESGELIWDQELGGAMAAQPIIEDGVLYLGAFDGRMYALEASNGELVQGFEFKAGNWIWSEALMSGEQLYVTALDGHLYALDPATGAEIPPYPYNSGDLSSGRDAIRAAPVETGDAILVATESGRVAAVNAATVRWSWPGGAPEAAVYTTPVVSGDRVFVILMNGQVQALDTASGAVGWSFLPASSQ